MHIPGHTHAQTHLKVVWPRVLNHHAVTCEWGQQAKEANVLKGRLDVLDTYVATDLQASGAIARQSGPRPPSTHTFGIMDGVVDGAISQ